MILPLNHQGETRNETIANYAKAITLYHFILYNDWVVIIYFRILLVAIKKTFIDR